MDDASDAMSASTQGATTMTQKTATAGTPAPEAPTMRRCIGSQRFGIEPHEAPIEDFPRQPSQKDGLGRMCKVHWRRYTSGLAREAKARKVAHPIEEAATEEVAAG
jgi:hypothetical protein